MHTFIFQYDYDYDYDYEIDLFGHIIIIIKKNTIKSISNKIGTLINEISNW